MYGLHVLAVHSVHVVHCATCSALAHSHSQLRSARYCHASGQQLFHPIWDFEGSHQNPSPSRQDVHNGTHVYASHRSTQGMSEQIMLAVPCYSLVQTIDY